MMKKMWIALLPLAMACTNNAEEKKAVVNYQPMTFAFGSCNDQNEPSPIFEQIGNRELTAFIWLGDIVYGDTDDPQVLNEAYNTLYNNDEYLQFRNRDIKIVGTWDDHDYGKNDAGKELDLKEERKHELLRFLEVPEEAEVWGRAGVYQSYNFGEHNEVKLLLLDTRTFRDEIILDPAPNRTFTNNPEGDILGEEQWAWLENELKDTTAKLVIIGSSIQLIAKDHGWEKWANFSTAIDRMYETIGSAKAKRVVVLSGDRHFAEISARDLEGKMLYDITSSGLNHPFIAEPDVNTYRVGEVVSTQNFGVLKVEWEGDTPILFTEIRGVNDELFLEIELN